MKTPILWMLALTIASVSNAQNVNIPDTAFLHALIEEGVDTNGDSLISVEEAKAVTSIDVGGLIRVGRGFLVGEISNLTGLEAFINLDSLKIQGNKVDSMDLSMNKDLRYLNCSYNNFSNLDVSNNTALTELECSWNYLLTSLDVTNNKALESLDCGGNQLTSLNVSSNTDLKYLLCDYNELTTLEISNNANLEYLDCKFNQLNILDVNNNKALKYLDCWNNQLTSLDVFNNTALELLTCSGNRLTSLDVSNNKAIKSLDCGGNQLTSLDVTNNASLESLDCGGNQLTSLNVSNNTVLDNLTCFRNQLTSLDVSNNIELVDLNISYMPTLCEVCVWESFPAGVGVKTEDSPNVNFTTVCAPTITVYYKENSTMNIYPNPSDDIINIEIENINNTTIEIYNVSGRLVLSKALNSKVEKIDVSDFSKGIYIVKVMRVNTFYVRKVVVK